LFESNCASLYRGLVAIPVGYRRLNAATSGKDRFDARMKTEQADALEIRHLGRRVYPALPD
jgi:hypothetical protein